MAALAPFMMLHPADNVAVARQAAEAGTEFRNSSGQVVVATERIEMGHKLAILPIAKGAELRKFGQPIGIASEDIAPGEWVHVHNVTFEHKDHVFEFGTTIQPLPVPAQPRTFMGYRRADGRAATRNYVAIVSTVNCSATSSRYIANAFDRSILENFPNVDGVIALAHKGGCGMGFGGEDHLQLSRTLAGFAKHANIAAYLIVGLGCETGQASFLAEEFNLVQLNVPSENRKKPVIMNIQEEGGVAKTVRRGVSILKELLPEVNKAQREPIPVSEIVLGTNCGGSDGNSGVTANPALGYASDLLVAYGGTSILAETTEIYGGEHLLTRRAVSREVGEKLLERIRWWEEYSAKFGTTINNNPSVGNKKGGLTTIVEKSLGAIAKGGQAPLQAVYEYGEPVTKKGFVIMDTPGYDPASVTGIIAGGSNVVVFTTGRGSCLGVKPVPTIKVATNSLMYNRMVDDMDINAGTILDGEKTVEEVGHEIFESIVSVASGEKTKSEAQGIGDEEFMPWTWGPVF
ncbi:UxaA family hydrolase [Planctomicrobium sp. SH664]|uniref:UxaA family hydrolase n=1 Tax=Planctomicrobium sp. SH664 TaxID=3448125 RepID=UPI003F5C5368